MISAEEALKRLRDGNLRFISNKRNPVVIESQAELAELAQGQEPFATVLGCSDSRVPVELVFDQGIGDLFVIRVAGNIAAPSQIGSVEFAATNFGTPLVVVLGHSQCGAILATLDHISEPSNNLSNNLQVIVDRVRPSVEDLLDGPLAHDRDRLVTEAVRENVRSAVYRLRTGSHVLASLIDRGRLMVVGAEYFMETGVVDFFDGV